MARFARTIHGGRGLLILALAVVVLGAALVTYSLTHQESAPQARSSGTIDAPSTTPSPTPSPSQRPTTADPAPPSAPAPLGPSVPARISIPAIGVDSVVNRIGLSSDGTLKVPQPGPRLNQAAWFEKSPTPGQPGPSIIEGHVDSESGPSVFFKLGSIRPGQRILVTRSDGTRLTFVVDGVRNYLKSKFPTRLVYGAKDLSTPALRLITCSQFDTATRHHIGNAVVFAHLSKVAGRHG